MGWPGRLAPGAMMTRPTSSATGSSTPSACHVSSPTTPSIRRCFLAWSFSTAVTAAEPYVFESRTTPSATGRSPSFRSSRTRARFILGTASFVSPGLRIGTDIDSPPGCGGLLRDRPQRPSRRSSSGRGAVEPRRWLGPPRAVRPRRPCPLRGGLRLACRREILRETTLRLGRHHERDRDGPLVHLDPVPVDERPAGRGRGSRLEHVVSLHTGRDEELVGAVRDVIAGPADRCDALLQDRHVQADARVLGTPLHGSACRDALATPNQRLLLEELAIHRSHLQRCRLREFA